jgi:hypothetical protein
MSVSVFVSVFVGFWVMRPLTRVYVNSTPRGAMSSADRVVGALAGMQKQLEQYTERVKSDKVSDHLSPRTHCERESKKTYMYVYIYILYYFLISAPIHPAYAFLPCKHIANLYKKNLHVRGFLLTPPRM